MSSYIGTLTVTDDFLNQVREGVGYPVITASQIDDLYDTDKIKSLIIGPALELFYNYFPIQEILDIPVSAGTEVTTACPNTNTLGIIHYGMSDGSNSSINLNTGNPFYTANQVYNSGSISQNFGTPFGYGASNYSVFQQQFYANSLKKMNHMYWARFDEKNKTIIAKSSLSGTIEVLLGTYDPDISNIPNRLKPHFLNYTQNLFSVKFGKLLKKGNMDLPLQIDADSLIENGQDELDKEMEFYQKNSTIPIMRR